VSRACSLRVALVRTNRTDVLCVACGRFRAEYAIVASGESGDFGVHRAAACRDRLRPPRAPKTSLVSEPPVPTLAGSS
jgi:hypothetical protein